MIIGIDGNEANVEKRVGISEYAFELLMQFSNSKFKIQNSKFVIYLKDEPRSDMPLKTESWKYRIIGPKKLWTQIGLPFDLYFHKPRPDLFFSPTHYAPRFSPVLTAISIMDLSYIHYPQLFRKSDLYQLRNWTAYSVRKAQKVFTISKASKDDIIKMYGVPSERVIVTYPGIKLKSHPFDRLRTKDKSTMQSSTHSTSSGLMLSEVEASKLLKDKYGVGGEYILFVGTLQPRKNIGRLIEAFSKIRNNLDLVIVGKKGWMYEEILSAPRKYGVEKHVQFLDFVPNEDLAVLYQNARCFVLPSLYEGFGLPVLEAMINGCPVIISNVSSLPEAGGDAALYVNPTDVGDIASKINKLLTDQKLRKELVEKGYQQVKKFSWEKTARETLKVLEEIGRTI